MKDKIFIDTNVFVYAYLENPKKREDYQNYSEKPPHSWGG
jgi:predicted nucleic acid-binding protein